MAYSINGIDLHKDSKSIINFWKKNFPKWHEEKFFWFYKENPYGEALCWFVRDQNNKNVGTTAVFPRNIYIKGQIKKAGITGDFGVNKDHRILGPAIQLQRATASTIDTGIFDILYGYPNNNSESVQRRVGFKPVGSTVRMIKILRSRKYIQRYIKLRVLSNLIGACIDILLGFFSKENRISTPKNIRSKIVTSFDSSFDELWFKAKKNFIISGEKSSKFLKWRFSNCPYINYITFALYNRTDKKLKGYVVFNAINSHLHIADILAEDNDESLDLLLSNFLIYVKKEKFETIEMIYFGNDFLVKKLHTFKFLLREAERKIVAFTNEDIDQELLFNKSNWYLTEGDND